jgi:hypothetical protein
MNEAILATGTNVAHSGLLSWEKKNKMQILTGLSIFFKYTSNSLFTGSTFY